MRKAIPREEMLRNFRAKIKAGEPIIGGGAGTGISAKMAEAGGIDLLIIYNSGRYRMAGRGSLAGLMAYGDANAIVLEMGHEVIPVVKKTPVLAGVNGTDPFRIPDVFLEEVKRNQFSGVQNFPTVGLIDGDFRKNIEATGMGYDKEVEWIKIASEMDLFCSPYVFDEKQAVDMVHAGADMLVAHVGLTTAGTIGAGVAFSLKDACDRVIPIMKAAKKERKDIIVLCHGGPFDEPDNVAKALSMMPGIAGFFGASSVERLPTERAIKEQVQAFKHVKVAH
jgi:predicted TIM-barrel enzyme